MNNDPNTLFEIVYQYYPRRLSIEQPAYKKSKEYKRRLKACRNAAPHREAWRAMLMRLAQHFPHQQVIDDTRFSMESDEHPLPSLSGAILLPHGAGVHGHSIEFCVSLLAPYYKIQSRLVVDELQEPEAGTNRQKSMLRLEFLSDEQPYAKQIAQEIEAAFVGYVCMPPDVGKLIVPEIASFGGHLERVTLYDCLMSPGA